MKKPLVHPCRSCEVIEDQIREVMGATLSAAENLGGKPDVVLALIIASRAIAQIALEYNMSPELIHRDITRMLQSAHMALDGKPLLARDMESVKSAGVIDDASMWTTTMELRNAQWQHQNHSHSHPADTHSTGEEGLAALLAKLGTMKTAKES